MYTCIHDTHHANRWPAVVFRRWAAWRRFGLPLPRCEVTAELKRRTANAEYCSGLCKGTSLPLPAPGFCIVHFLGPSLSYGIVRNDMTVMRLFAPGKAPDNEAPTAMRMAVSMEHGGHEQKHDKCKDAMDTDETAYSHMTRALPYGAERQRTKERARAWSSLPSVVTWNGVCRQKEVRQGGGGVGVTWRRKVALPVFEGEEMSSNVEGSLTIEVAYSLTRSVCVCLSVCVCVRVCLCVCV